MLYKEIFDFNIKNNMHISSSDNEIYIQLLLYLFYESATDSIVVTSNIEEATRLYNILKKYINDLYIFPEDSYITKKAIASSPEFTMLRLELLNQIKNIKKKVVISHLDSFIKPLPSKQKFNENLITLKENKKILREDLVKLLLDLGYKKTSLVTNSGEFSVRGFIVDVFLFDEEDPIRIELFDDEIEKIKYFDSFTQRSIKKIKSIEIKAFNDEIGKLNSTVLEYLDKPLVIIQDFNKILQSEKNLNMQRQVYEKSLSFKSFEEILPNSVVYVDLINNTGNFDLSFLSKKVKKYNEQLDSFVKDIENEKNAILYVTNENIIKALPTKIKIKKEFLNEGFSYNGITYYSENDLKKEIPSLGFNNRLKIGKKISGISKLNIGDYCIHKTHGIGVYQGIKVIEVNGIKKDYILLQYAGTDKLYLPAQNIDKLYKYSSKEGTNPKINKLNSKEWEKTKLKIRKRIHDITDELISIYKKRSVATVDPFLPDTNTQILFEKKFDYSMTLDQLKVTEEIKRDLEGTKPMDRLLCGDVGYGKTEVIFRSVFKTILNLKQVMYLCPTTLLSFQQYKSALKRFEGFGLNIEVFNRYTSLKDKNRILQGLKSGKIDLIIGTHRLLSKDVEFKELGLLVIDEEQRFGVKQKDEMKKYKDNVHVLSVSATPIPRSLQMSLVGIRDLSLIDTPPKNRYPVQTYVINYDELIIREAILKEISRKGQIFILFNNIEHMPELFDHLKKIVPEARFNYAHSKMTKEYIQDLMLNFVNYEFDCLISTTIIENGIDIPNANTMIVLNADLFGLSQLYQIRGRVGRSDKIAYAYLFYDKSKILTQTAIKRLDAIKEFTELGSGYSISMRDLSIRGAGDLLGSEQAGFIDAVGVDMYLDLINEEMNGIEEEEDAISTISDIENHISEVYSQEDEIIIELHTKINDIETIEDLNNLYEEIKDRFGKVSEDLVLYMYQTLFEKYIQKLNINILQNNSMLISIMLKENLYNRINVEKLFINSTKICGNFNFLFRNNKIIIKLNKKSSNQHYIKYMAELLLLIDSLHKD